MATGLGKFHFRLVLLGSNGTGFLFKKFEPKHKPTVEDLFSQDFDLGNIEIKVDFLDTSGSMQFPAMRRLSIKTGSAFLIVYSVDDESSYDVVKMCVAEIQEIRPDYQEIPIVFAGNKCDTMRAERKVPKELVSNYVYYELPRLRAKVIECSCKENINIDNIFKAYLSLAKISMPSTVATGLKQKRLPRMVADESQGEYDYSCINSSNSPSHNERQSSVKSALGIRNSCDASIVTSMRNISITGSHNSKETPTTMRREHDSQIASQNSNQFFIRDALQQSSKLAIDHGPKPRSRSLIWRSHRKSSTRTASESSDCRIS